MWSSPTNPVFSTRSSALWLIAAFVLGLPADSAPQSAPTGRQEYFILAYDQHVWDMMDKVENGEGGGPFANAINSVVTATASADNQVITYDHWEDGLEADILNPVQASTLVIGDGNPANGDACDFNSDPCGVDRLFVGSFVNFASDQGILAGCTIPSSSPLIFTELCSSVPVNPRCATPGSCTNAEVRFDGGDFLETSGGPLSLIHTQDPLTQFIGGSTEIISRQAVEAARQYSVPVGEDLYTSFGCPNCVMEPFHYVDLNLVAFDDGTSVFVDSPGGGQVSFTLNRGEHWSSLGFIDDGPFDPNLLLTVNSGTRISTSGPIAGLLFTGGDGTWATRHYALLPDILHSTDYVITAPGDDPALPVIAGTPPDRPLNIYIFNPDPFNAITVTATDTVGTTNIVIPANSSVDYFTGTGRFVPNGSTVRMISNRNFWGVSAYDHDTNISDWGHSWLAKKFLTTTYTTGLAPGNVDPTVNMVNLNGVFIAATEDNTRVQIDLDNDLTFDQVDTDGDGVGDPAPLPNNTYTVNALGALRVFDHNDFDNTGTRIITNKPVAVAWGQDTDLTGFGDVARDTGYTVYPVNQLFLNPVLVLEKTAGTQVVPTTGGTVRYTLTLSTFDFGPLTSLQIYDLLPPGVVSGDYVPGSTLITYPDLSQDTSDPATSIDPTTGRDRLDWTLSPDSLDANRTLTVSYDIAIPPAPGGAPRMLTNEGHAQGSLGGSTFSPFDTSDVVQSDIALSKSVNLSLANPNDVLTYTLLAANNGVGAETNVSISDAIPPDTTFVTGSIMTSGPFAGSYSAAQNSVMFTAANLPPGGPHTLSFQVRINPIAASGTLIPNHAGYESTETPFFHSNEVQTRVTAPDLVVSKSGPPVLREGDIATFEIKVENRGAASTSNVIMVDAFPTNTTYVPESMTFQRNVNPFQSVTDAADGDEGTAFVDHLELAIAVLGPGEDLTFRFDVQVDPGTVGLFVNNQATVASDQVPAKFTNLVQVPIVGQGEVSGHVFLDLNGNGNQDPGEPDMANVDVVVTDSTGVVQTVSTDGNGNYTTTVDFACYDDFFAAPFYNGSNGNLDWSATPWVELLDDGSPSTGNVELVTDPLNVFGNSLVIREQDPLLLNRGLERPADLSAATSATLDYDFRRVSMAGGDVITVDVSYDGGLTFPDSNVYAGGADGTWQSDTLVLDPARLPSANIVVRIRTTGGFDGGSDDFYWDNITLCQTQVTLDVDETDPDFPNGATLTTANDPQTIAAVAGATVASAPVGYQPLPLTLNKRSDAVDGEVSPGQTVTYTVTLTNNTAVTQTGIAITDPLPTGTSAVPGSTTVTVLGGTANYRDNFVAVAYNGTNGSINWSATPWVELLDGGSPTGGDVQVLADPLAVNGNSLWVDDQSPQALGTGAQRPLDLSTFVTATLTYDFRRVSMGGSDQITVDVSCDGGLSFPDSNVYTGGGTDGSWQSDSLVLDSTQLPSANVIVRVRTTSGFTGGGDTFYMDNVDVTGTVAVTAPGHDPPGLVIPADGYTLAPNASLVVTFQVVVDFPLDPAINQITNTATVNTNQQGPFNASVTDDVVRLGVTVEPNNAGFAIPGGTVTYTHQVVNAGQLPDAYDMTIQSELGYQVELIDPETGTVLATDSDGDGVWDGGVTINTGTLNPGEDMEYRVRVTVPAGTPIGTEESTTLFGRSTVNTGLVAFATDETTVVESLDIGPVMLLPDHSGVVLPGGSIAYTHSLINNTGATDTFDLTAAPTAAGWTATIYNDSNGDGVYTPGFDVAIANSKQLADGELQTLFVIVDAPAGAMQGDSDVTHLTAISRNDTDLFDAATDTTTVIPATTHDLSGGGTLRVDQGEVAVFPGTVKNLTDSAQRYDFSITASLFFGLDGLNHPTQLVIDTNGDGVPDTQIAEDADGDGTWDTVAPGFDTNMDGNPDVAVAASSQLAYELRRPVDPAQPAYRDPVTLTATSQSTSEVDRVTVTNLLAAVTHALVVSFEASLSGGSVVLEWETALEVGTVGFYVERWDETGAMQWVRESPVPAILVGQQGGHYQLVDPGARPGVRYSYVLVELDQRGAERRFGPFEVVATKAKALTRGLLEAGYTRELRRSSYRPPVPKLRDRPKSAGVPSGKLRVPIEEKGLVHASATDLASAMGETVETVRGLIASGNLIVSLAPDAGAGKGFKAGCGSVAADPTLFADGFESGDLCAWSSFVVPQPPPPGAGLPWLAEAGDDGLYFYAEGIDSIYTTRNIYWLQQGAGVSMNRASAGTPVVSPGESFVESLHFENETVPMTAVIEDPESDFWFWDFLLAGHPDLGAKSFTLNTPGVVPGGSGATLRVQMHAQTSTEAVAQDHRVLVNLNGSAVGELLWDGSVAHEVTLPLPPGTLVDGDNSVELTAVLEDGVPFDVLFLEAFDVSYLRFYRAVADRLEAPSQGRRSLTLEGFTRSDIVVFDISDPTAPRAVEGTEIEDGVDGYQVSFRARGSRYLAVALDGAQPAAFEVDLASDLRASSNAAEYVVIAGPGLESGATALASYRTGTGLSTVVVRLQDIYDEFNGGVASPFAIRDFLAHARTTWAVSPRMVAIAGDGTFDHKDIFGTGENLVPVPMVGTADGLFPSDNRLADLTGDDGAPEIAIGRLAVHTNEELTDYLAKLQAFESSAESWRQDTVWVADGVDEGGEFPDDSDDLIELLPPSLAVGRIYVDDPDVADPRAELLAAFDSGALLVNYLGHGGADRLATEGLMTTGDVPGLTNSDRAPILAALTCAVGRFDFPGFDTLSETLVLHDQGGAVALWSPSGLSFNHEAVELANLFLLAAFDGSGATTVGELAQEALQGYLGSFELNPKLPFLMNLQGDPAILLQP